MTFEIRVRQFLGGYIIRGIKFGGRLIEISERRSKVLRFQFFFRLIFIMIVIFKQFQSFRESFFFSEYSLIFLGLKIVYMFLILVSVVFFMGC